MTPDERAARGREAKWLLEQDVFKEAMDRLIRMTQTQWASTDMEDTKRREDLYHRFRAIEDIRPMLNNFQEDGRRAEEELNGN